MLINGKRRKPYIWAVIALIAGITIDHSLIYQIQKHEQIKQSQQQTSNETIEAASDQTIATYTEYLAILTGVLALVGIAQGIFTVQQIRLAKSEFNATHRPKIITRFFRVNTTERGVGLEKFTNVSFLIANDGSSNAFVTEIGTRVFNWPGPYTKGAREIEFNVRKSTSVLGAGEDVPLYTEHTFPRALTLVDRPENSSDIWWCIGYIKYRDANGIGRVTGFCRKWNFKTKAWDREPDDDWEYSY